MPDPQQYDALRTEALLLRVDGGDHDAWRELYRRYRPFLMLAVRADSGRRLEDPDDILQSAFLSAWKDIEQFKYKGTGSFRSWLGMIVVRKSLEKLKRLRTPTERDDLKPDWIDHMHDNRERDPADSAENLDSQQRLLECMDKHLKPIENEILILREFEGLSTVHVAEIVELSETSVKNHYRAGMDRITQALKEEAG